MSPIGIATAHDVGCHGTDEVTDATAKLRSVRGLISRGWISTDTISMEAEDGLEREAVSVLTQTQDGLGRRRLTPCLLRPRGRHVSSVQREKKMHGS